MQLSIRIVVRNDTAILVCEGNVVKGRETEILARQIALQKHRVVILDFEAVHKIDAAGLGVLVAAHQDLLIAGRCLVLGNVTGSVMEVLQKTRLNRILAITELEDSSDVYMYTDSRQKAFRTAG